MDKTGDKVSVLIADPITYERDRFTESELVIALVGAVGSRLDKAKECIEKNLQIYGYNVDAIKVSKDVIPLINPKLSHDKPEYERINAFMDAGDLARRISGDNSILALGAASRISEPREIQTHPDTGAQITLPRMRQAYIIDSLKRPEEVEKLRYIYSEGFYLIGVYSGNKSRVDYLTGPEDHQKMTKEEANFLIKRDEDENLPFGQQTIETFHLSDFFVHIDDNVNEKEYQNHIIRFLDIIFGHPFKTPTHDEYAMFLAFTSSLRSADLARQVGAVIVNDCNEIISMGFNDVPKFKGGLHQPEFCKDESKIIDKDDGRDYKIGHDSNIKEIKTIIKDIVKLINKNYNTEIDANELITLIKENKARIRDITEYGRTVHAEMEALLFCSRSGINLRGATIYCTTYPCHNCAKHILAAGIIKVVYIEPYQKSHAIELHPGSIHQGLECPENKLCFQPFIGVGPRRFFDLYSTMLSSGYPIDRKDHEGKAVEWNPKNADLRMQLLPESYLGREEVAVRHFMNFNKGCEKKNG